MYCDASINGMAAHVPTHIYRHDMTTIMIMVVMGRPAHISTLASIAIARCKVIRSLGNCMHVYILLTTLSVHREICLIHDSRSKDASRYEGTFEMPEM